MDDSDPYMNLGFGMVAYFRMLSSFIIVFFIFSLISIPAIGIFSSYNGLADLSNYSKTKYSLGNLGFSENICVSMYVGVGMAHNIQCKVGTISKLYSFGLIPSDFNQPSDFCGTFVTTMQTK